VKTITAALMTAFLIVCMAPTASAQSLGPGLVTIHASETPLSDVLAILSEKSGLNIVASTEVEGRLISISLRETPVEEALNLIVRAAGLGYERIGNSILVAPETVLVQETGLGTYVIPLEFADAFELVDVVGTMVDKVAADPGGNRLIVVATPGMIDQIRSVISELDVPPVQIVLETEVIEVSTDDLMQLGVDWQKITQQTVIFSETDLGLEPQDTDKIPATMPFRGRGVDWDGIYRQAKALEVALDLLETEGKARVLTRAKLATLNNRKAEIHIGDVIPYRRRRTHHRGGRADRQHDRGLPRTERGDSLDQGAARHHPGPSDGWADLHDRGASLGGREHPADQGAALGGHPVPRLPLPAQPRGDEELGSHHQDHAENRSLAGVAPRLEPGLEVRSGWQEAGAQGGPRLGVCARRPGRRST
jgi:type II secretory pathway component GspD/PulD (secretin)